MGLTADLGAFVARMREGEYPADALSCVRTGFADCVAVMIAGEHEPVTQIVAEWVGAGRQSHGTRLGRLGVAAPDAALVYGTAAHALDYDDTGLAGHPSAVLVPAIIAEAQEAGADGATMARAYIAGYEVWADLVYRDRDQHHRKGWHPTAVFGTLAAASVGAVIRKLDRDQATAALGLAASLAGGIVANFGTMTKPFQVGRAAQSGLLAARLAERGLSAAPDALEHDSGFLRAVSPSNSVDTASPTKAGSDWRILRSGTNIKLYPVCYAMHRVIDAMLELVRGNDLQADAIASVELEMGQTQAGMLRNHRPQTGLDAKFSVEFAMAAAAIARRCGRDELNDDFVRRPDVQRFFSKVTVVPIAEKDPEDPVHSPFDRVAIVLHDGRRFVADPVYYPRGHFRRPVNSADLWDKFSDCVSAALGKDQARRLYERLQAIDSTKSISDIIPN